MKKFTLIREACFRTGLFFTAALVFVVSLFPFIWALLSSFKHSSELLDLHIIFPKRLYLGNYLSIFSEQAFGGHLVNSFVVASTTVVLSLAIGLMASYALSRWEFRGRKLLLFSFLGVSMFPQIAVLSGLVELLRFLGLYNNWFGLTLSYMIFTLPFTIWMLTTFMKDIPIALEEAAVVDGAGPFRILITIFLPLLAPSLASTAILAFIAAWNEFLFALTFTLTDRARTVPVSISMMSGASQFELPWGNIMAASVIVTIPVLGLVLIFSRKIISGLTAGSIKS